ncbi:hypothetical protein D3C74_193990 [compost metagenome]
MLKVPYIFVCKEAQSVVGGIDISNIFNVAFVQDSPSFIEGVNLVIGIVGVPDDDGQEFILKIRGKSFETVTLPPISYEFIGYDIISVSLGEFDRIPVIENETIYFEVYYKEKLIAQYPLKIFREEVKENGLHTKD